MLKEILLFSWFLVRVIHFPQLLIYLKSEPILRHTLCHKNSILMPLIYWRAEECLSKTQRGIGVRIGLRSCCYANKSSALGLCETEGSLFTVLKDVILSFFMCLMPHKYQVKFVSFIDNLSPIRLSNKISDFIHLNHWFSQLNSIWFTVFPQIK